jgi:hypothetical protein
VKFLVSTDTTQTTCLRKKMLVALTVEGKFSGEGIHSLESDDDMMSAMARELVERGRVGESADALWADLKRERDLHLCRKPAQPPQDTVVVTEEELAEMPLLLPPPVAAPLSALTLVQSATRPKQKPSPLRPTGHAEGKQLLLFA